MITANDEKEVLWARAIELTRALRETERYCARRSKRKKGKGV